MPTSCLFKHRCRPPPPHRSFILQRLLDKAQGKACGQMVLYFGCRRSDQDYLYGDVLQGWADKGDITLYTAFSRQQVRGVKSDMYEAIL